LRRRSFGSAEVDVSDPIDSEACDVPTVIDRLSRAVEHLEAALAERERVASEESRRVQEMRREVEALRALQHTVAHRLDAAIARLKETIED
jgi:predicted transcriptional regulator